jgi:hypothetical protein
VGLKKGEKGKREKGEKGGKPELSSAPGLSGEAQGNNRAEDLL